MRKEDVCLALDRLGEEMESLAIWHKAKPAATAAIRGYHGGCQNSYDRAAVAIFALSDAIARDRVDLTEALEVLSG